MRAGNGEELTKSFQAEKRGVLAVYLDDDVSHFHSRRCGRRVAEDMRNRDSLEIGTFGSQNEAAGIGCPRLRELSNRFEDHLLMRVIEDHSKAAEQRAADGA